MACDSRFVPGNISRIDAMTSTLNLKKNCAIGQFYGVYRRTVTEHRVYRNK